MACTSVWAKPWAANAFAAAVRISACRRASSPGSFGRPGFFNSSGIELNRGEENYLTDWSVRNTPFTRCSYAVKGKWK